MKTDQADFKITTDGVAGKIEVNGEDVSGRVSRVVFEVGHDTPSRLGLELSAGAAGTIEGKGVVTVMDAIVPGDIVGDWLDKIDGDALSQAVLADRRGLGGKDPIAAALDKLKEWARGAATGT